MTKGGLLKNYFPNALSLTQSSTFLYERFRACNIDRMTNVSVVCANALTRIPPNFQTCFCDVLGFCVLPLKIFEELELNTPPAIILIVDDFADMREMLKLTLSSLGYRVLEAEDGRGAVEITISQKPDLILMDLAMPVLSGLEAIREIRGIDGSCQTPIIAVSAYDNGDYQLAAISAGCDAYLTKPLDFTYLEVVMSKFLKISADL
jgi:two-component system, cell cycle response regulator DivK